jgi:hypothetical protein
MTIIKATPEDAGCYVTGWWGQYAGAHMIAQAQQFGYVNDEVTLLAMRHVPHTDDELSFDELEALDAGAEDAERWLNDNVAPNDYLFGWHDGEFYLASVDWWNEDSGL